MIKTFSINQRIAILKNMKILEKIAVVEGDYYTTNFSDIILIFKIITK